MNSELREMGPAAMPRSSCTVAAFLFIIASMVAGCLVHSEAALASENPAGSENSVSANTAKVRSESSPKGTGLETKLASDSKRIILPGEQESVSASQGVKKDLGSVTNDALLKQGRAFKSRGGDSVVKAERSLAKEARKAEKSLKFGVFRNESLADGAVAAPGIEDFAAFFRASSQATVQGQTQGDVPKAKARLGERDDVYLQRQAEAEKLRIQTVESIKKILATNPTAEQKLNLLMRLAEIQIESHAYILELEIQNFNTAYDQWLKTKKGPEPQFSNKNSKARLLSGIDTMRSAAKEFPAHARTPEILFNLGFLLNQVESDSAKLYFEQLVKKFPESDFVPKAYLALGEFYFQKTQFTEALKMYQAVLKYKGTDSYSYAVYKIGWAYFNLPGNNASEHRQNLGKSLAAFKLLIKLSDAPEASQQLKALRAEALKDMILVYVDLKDIAGAEQFYASLNEQDLYYTFLERLAWQTTEAGEFDAAISIYRKLIEEAKTHKRMPTYLTRLIEIQEKRNDFASLLAALKFMSTTLGKDSQWHKANASNAEVMADRNSALEKAFTYWPKLIHAQAQKTKRPEYYGYALEAYLIHLQNMPSEPESYDSYFYSGEIYVYQKRYEEAAAQYSRATALDEKLKLGNKLTRDALLNAIASLDLAIAEKPAPALPEAGKATGAIPLPALQSKLLWCLDAFARLFPADSETVAIMHRAAKYQYAFGEYNSSLERWMALAKKAPKSEEAGEGIRMILRVYLNREDWKGTRDVGQSFLSLNGVSDAYVARDIVSVMKVALFQLAMQREREKKHSEAESLFVSYQKEYSDDPDSPKALYNAANNAFKNGAMDSAVTHLKTLLSQYQKSSLVPDALYLIANSADGLGLFSESAIYYEQLFREHGKHKLAEAAAFRALEQRDALAEYEAVEISAKQLLAAWPNGKSAPEAWTLLGRSYEARSRFKLASETYSDAVKAVGVKKPEWAVYFYALGANANELGGSIAERNKLVVLGLKTFEKLSTEDKASAAAVEGISKIAALRIADVESDFKKVTKLRITDGLQLTDQFTVIRSEVEKVAKEYVEIVKLGNAEVGIQALFRVAEMQSFLAQVLLSAPVPQGASALEAEQFKGTLERIALPLQEEAINLYLTAWQRSKETESITPFTNEIYNRLVELRPAEFKKLEGRMPPSSYYSNKMVFNRDTKQYIEN